MSPPTDPLPPDVTAAIARGDKLQAIQLLRKATGLSLAEAKQAIEHPARAPSLGPNLAIHTLAPEVLAELARGNKIEAIKLLRGTTGLGLKEAKDMVDAAASTAGSTTLGAQGLAPGEVPRSTGKSWVPWALLMVAVAVLGAYLKLRS